MIKASSTPAQVLVTIFDQKLFEESLKVANLLRKNDIKTMLYSGLIKKLDKQLKYADKKGISWVIIVGPDEVKQDKVTLKNMSTGKQETLSLQKAIEKIKK